MHAAHQLHGLRSMRPLQELTAGLLAFLALTPLCTALRLYGFGGGANIDGHHLNDQTHAYATEHDLLRSLSRGVLNGLQLHGGSGVAHGQLLDGEEAHAKALIERLRCTLQRQAASGLLQIVPAGV